ncbi:MAG: hypothetical protein WAT66_07565 [Actinomycetota bacterium]
MTTEVAASNRPSGASSDGGSVWARMLAPPSVAAIAVLGSVLAKMLSQTLSDPDLWWHLKTGSIIAGTHSIPHADAYSYTVPGKDWVVQEWGSEVILHGIRDAFGLWGIFFWRALMLLLIYAIVGRLLVRRMGNTIGTWVVLALVAYGGSANWTERPNLFSFTFVALLLLLIDRRDRSIWWVVPIAVVWANLHGMVILGIGLIGLVAVVEALKLAFNWAGGDRAWTKRLAAVTGVSAVAILVNPRGPGLLLHSYRLVRDVSQVVTEWFSPDFHELSSFLFLVLLLVTIATLALHPTRPDPTDVALALAFTVLALQAVRNLAVAAIVLGFVAARYLPGTLEQLRGKRPPSTAMSPLFGVVAIVVIVVAFGLVGGRGFPSSDDLDQIVDPAFPVAAIEALDRPGVRLFTQDAWAGLVIDQDWPNVHVFYDTRVDLYGRERAVRYARTIAAFPGWDGELDKTCTTHVLVRPIQPLARVLQLSPGWMVDRQDRRSITFSRVSPPSGCET